jgi:phage terminase large subunit
MILNLSDVIVPAFYDFWCVSRDAHFLYYILKGGRNSAKSTTASQRVICDIIDMPINALVVRKVANTLKESVYEQLKEAIFQLDVEKYFKVLKSPMEIEYLPRGNKIIFRGADDPQKIKSIKTSKFPIARLWIEELAEFKTEDEVQTIVDSLLRAKLPKGLEYKVYYSYNPPRKRQLWVNKKFNTANLPDNVYVHHSTYFDNPYASEQMIREAEEMKKRNEQKYKWNYLGEAIGGGIIPFNNLVFEKLSNEKVASFDNIREGIDWGYSTDPFVWVQLHYDKMRRILYIYDEIYRVQMSNREAAEKIRKRQKTRIISDVEPKSVAEMMGYGIKIRQAMKGAGSPEYGEKWLDDLDAIIIDPARCPNTSREFESIDYKTDIHGDLIPRLEDKDNHTIDAVRYAMENDMGYKGWGFGNY